MNRCPVLSFVLFMWAELVFITLLRKGTVVVDLPPLRLANFHPDLSDPGFSEGLRCR